MTVIKGIASKLENRVKEYSNMAKSRLNKTKKIKAKMNTKLQKQSSQQKFNIDYGQNPQQLIENTFNILDMKCEIKSDVLYINIVVNISRRYQRQT